MKSRVKIATVVAATLVGATALTSAAVYATEASQPASSDKSDVQAPKAAMQTSQTQAQAPDAVATDFLKLSQDGLKAVANIHAARLAIYNGNEDAALKLLQKAQTQTSQAEADATTLDKIANTGTKADGSDKTASSGDRYLPVDARISVNDEYGLKPAESSHLQKASAAMKQGDNKAALQHIALIDQNVVYTYAAVPYDGLKTNVDKAVQDLKDKKAQAANLALKSVEDSLVINQMSVDGAPQQQAPAAKT